MRHSAKLMQVLLGSALFASAGTAASASIITDAAFFPPIPHTLISFESDGNGNEIPLLNAATQAMPADAYSAQGVSFTSPTGMRWTNDGNTLFDAAQLSGGSPANAIPSTFVNNFTITFSVPVRAFGMLVVNNRLRDPIGPTFFIRDTQGNMIDTLTFDSVFYDGQFANANTVADYGFLGAQYGVDIGSIEISKTHAIFDDLRFSAVPAPGPIALTGLALLAAARRRR